MANTVLRKRYRQQFRENKTRDPQFSTWKALIYLMVWIMTFLTQGNNNKCWPKLDKGLLMLLRKLIDRNETYHSVIIKARNVWPSQAASIFNFHSLSKWRFGRRGPESNMTAPVAIHIPNSQLRHEPHSEPGAQQTSHRCGIDETASRSDEILQVERKDNRERSWENKGKIWSCGKQELGRYAKRIMRSIHGNWCRPF